MENVITTTNIKDFLNSPNIGLAIIGGTIVASIMVYNNYTFTYDANKRTFTFAPNLS